MEYYVGVQKHKLGLYASMELCLLYYNKKFGDVVTKILPLGKGMDYVW